MTSPVSVVQAELAFALPSFTGETLPGEIQYMPPGRNTIRALRDGQAETFDVIADEAGAAIMQASLDRLLAAYAAGEGSRPWFDFNHEGCAASAHPTAFRWGGSDPRTGGIRVALTWTRGGSEAVLGRDFTSFSPAFAMDKASGRLAPTTLTNLGGLVNEAAFQRIRPVLGRQQPNPNPEMTTQNTTILAALVAASLVPAATADTPEAIVAALQGAAEQTKKAAKDLEAAVQARQEAEAKLKTEQDAHVTARKAYAERLVAQAQAIGSIPPQCPAEVRARWVANLAADVANADLLPAPSTVLAGRVTETGKEAGDGAAKVEAGKQSAQEPKGADRMRAGLAKAHAK